MSDPVTVFMLVVSGLLVVGAIGEQIFARTGVPAVIWLILLGVLVRATDIVPLAVVTALAPFFAALALVLILFDAGRHLSMWTGDEVAPPGASRRALLLAVFGFMGTTLLAALLSMGLYGLNILPAWGWTHAFMLGSLISAGAGEVFLPSLQAAGADAGTIAVLRREAAITKTLAVAGTVLFIDLLSPRVADGGAAMALVAGFGFALTFGSVAGMAWIMALQRLSDNPRNYLYTLATMLALYVLSEAMGGSGPLSVLVFGVTLGNAGPLLGLLRRKGEAPDPAAGAVVHAALEDHEGTIQFVRTLVFAMVGLLLVAPPWGPLIMGIPLGFLPLIVRQLVARFVVGAGDRPERSLIGSCGPRGMATVALATLPLAHGVPGSASMVTLVFSAVTTSVIVFTISMRHAGRTPVKEEVARPAAPVMRTPGKPLAGVDVRAPTMPERREGTGDTERVEVDIAAPIATPLELAAVLPVAAPPVAHAPVESPTLPVAAPPAAPSVAPPAAPSFAPPVNRTAVTEASAPVNRTVVAEAPPVKGRTVIAEAPAPANRTVVAGSRAPLVGMQEHPGPAPAPRPGRAPEVYMPTLPTIDAAKAHGENPLDSAMQRALSKRPQDVTAGRPRATGEFATPPPSFAKFEGASEDDTTNVLAVLSEREKKSAPTEDDTTGVLVAPPGRENK